jgi:cobalt-zinc-cadmium efflux system protein
MSNAAEHDRRHTHPPAHRHAHAHGRAGSQRRLALVLALVLGYSAVELVGGIWTGSLALLSDALHMVSDSAALALSLLAGYLASRPAQKRRTFGNSRVEILAALANGVALAVVALFISVNALERYFSPQDVAGAGLFAVASGGLAVNLVALYLLEGGRESSLNERGAYLHVMSDTLASLGVCLAGVGIWTLGWLWLDPVVSLVVSVLVLGSAWQLVRDALEILMETVPPPSRSGGDPRRAARGRGRARAALSARLDDRQRRGLALEPPRRRSGSRDRGAARACAPPPLRALRDRPHHDPDRAGRPRSRCRIRVRGGLRAGSPAGLRSFGPAPDSRSANPPFTRGHCGRYRRK